jgi:hypothetical protein
MVSVAGRRPPRSVHDGRTLTLFPALLKIASRTLSPAEPFKGDQLNLVSTIVHNAGI